MVRLSVITLTYNNLEYTKKFIESLYKYTSDFELIIVDNGSTDGTVDYLKSLKNIKVIFNAENAGYSKGNNQGLEIAEGEYIGFLNNDILLSPNWFEKCEEVFEKENAGFVSPVQLNPRFNRVSEKNYLKRFRPKDGYQKTFDNCEFACCVTKRSVLEKIGNFDENFTPAFWEDDDMKYRAIDAGYDNFVVESACFFHYGSVTSIKLNQNFEKNRQYYYSKHKFAPYLPLSADEIYALKVKLRFFEGFPFSLIYSSHMFVQKVIRNLKRIIGR